MVDYNGKGCALVSALLLRGEKSPVQEIFKLLSPGPRSFPTNLEVLRSSDGVACIDKVE